MIDNPVFRRELLERLRSGKTIASLLAVAIVSVGLVLLRWPSDATVDMVSQGAMHVFRPLCWGIAAAVVLLVPAFPATSLVRERNRGTLALILHSPLGAASIFSGKFLANVLLMVLLTSASLPAMAACYSMGGTSVLYQIVPLYLTLFMMAVLFTAVGLLISSHANTPDSSLRWTYAAVLAIVALSLAPNIFVGGVKGNKAQIADWLTNFSPIPAISQLTDSGQVSIVRPGRYGWPGFIVASAGLSAVLGVMTLRRLRPSMLDRSRDAGRVTEQQSNTTQWLRRFAFLVDPNRRKPGIPKFINPIMVKEFRTRKFGRLHWLIRLVAICAVVSLALTVVAASGTVSWGVERIASAMVVLQISLLVLLGPSLASGLIAGELETGGWQLLRATPLSAVKIISGKLMSVIWTMALVFLATLPGYIVMVFIQPALGTQVEKVLISLGIAALMIVMTSAAVSAYWNRTAGATATSYALLLLLFAGTMLVWMARERPFGQDVVERVLMLNPAAAALAEMRTPGMEIYNLTPGSWYIGGSVALFVFVALIVRVWTLVRPD